MNKKLVCYFSASGVTRKVANDIASSLEADIFEIEPEEKYTEEDLDWTNKESRSSIEMSDKNSRPKILKKMDNINNYDTIIIGFPVWWYTAPTIINTFIEENDLSNKKIYIFVTSGSSSEESSLKDLQSKYNTLNIINAKRFTINTPTEEYKEWIR